ncbi:MAG: MotA/TolQ/ExbB proton channel family protein [Planctomycetota bacterium]
MLAPVLPAAAPAASRSLLDYIAAGREIGAVIILLSIVALALVIAGVIRTQRSRFLREDVSEKLDELLQRGETDAAEAYCRDPENDCFLSRLFAQSLERCRRSPFGFLEIRSALEESGREQVSRAYRSADWIGLIASVAPMLGLLGTVVGILVAFDTISRTDGVPRPGELAGGISQALVTTVMGLLVAIPCTFAYTYLRNRVDQLAAETGEHAERMASLLEGAAPDRANGSGGGGAA